MGLSMQNVILTNDLCSRSNRMYEPRTVSDNPIKSASLGTDIGCNHPHNIYLDAKNFDNTVLIFTTYVYMKHDECTTVTR